MQQCSAACQASLQAVFKQSMFARMHFMYAKAPHLHTVARIAWFLVTFKS
jgi:hypothetical protein